MPRLGSRYTVSGYLNEVARRSFLVTTDEGPANLTTFLGQLPRDWTINDFVALFEERLLPFGWSYNVDSERSALGRRTHIQVFLPSVLQIIHAGKEGLPAWTEKALTAHCWSIKVRKGKAKLDVIPTSLYISEHALRRVYERSGGCAYEEFPQLVAALFQELLEKTDTLLREVVFVPIGVGQYATAVPTSGGLVVVNWNVTQVHRLDPIIGMAITIRRNSYSRSPGSFNPNDFWKLNSKNDIENMYNLPSSFVRTFYSDADMSEKMTNSSIILDIILNNVNFSIISPYNLMKASKDPSGRRILPEVGKLFPESTSGLRADAVESLHWLKAEDNGNFHLVPYHKGAEFTDFLNSHDFDENLE